MTTGRVWRHGVLQASGHRNGIPPLDVPSSRPAVYSFIRETVVRWHQSQLLFEGNRRGAVFTVVLPRFERSVSRG